MQLNRFYWSWLAAWPWSPARGWVTLLLVTAWFCSHAQPGQTDQVPVTFRVYTATGKIVTPASPGWRVGYVQDAPLRRTLWLTQPPPPERVDPSSWNYNAPEEKPTQELARSASSSPSDKVSGFFHARTKQYVLLIGRHLLRTTTSHYCLVHERDTMRIYPEGGVGHGWDPDSLPFHAGTFHLPAYVLWTNHLLTCRSPRYCPGPLLRPTPGVHTDWSVFLRPLPVVYAELVTIRVNDRTTTGPYRLLDSLVPVRRDSVGAIVAYYGQEPADGLGGKTTPFILRDVPGQHVLYELRDVRPDSLVEGAPRRLRAGPTDTTLRTWHNMGLWLYKITVDAEGRFWALAARQYPATARRAAPSAHGTSEPVSSLDYGLFRLYFPGELTAEELQAKQAHYWQQFYEALAEQPAEQRLIAPYVAP
jgi:hypothetical protein